MAALRTAGELMPPGLKLRITGIGDLPIYNFDLRRILDGLGVHWLAKPEIFIGMAQSKFGADGKLNDEPTRKIMTDQMLAFEDWIRRMKRAFE
jgi:hypothetical protein